MTDVERVIRVGVGAVALPLTRLAAWRRRRLTLQLHVAEIDAPRCMSSFREPSVCYVG